VPRIDEDPTGGRSHSTAEDDTPPLRFTETGKRRPLPRKVAILLTDEVTGSGPWMNFLLLPHEIRVVKSTSSTVRGRWWQ